MKLAFRLLFFLSITTSIVSCGFYSFSGISIAADIKTFQVDFFRNKAARVIPGIDQRFTNALQDRIMNQTSLDLVNTDGQLIYEGEITRYMVVPTSNTSDQTAALNRMTIGVQLRFTNTKDDKENLERSFSYFYDFDANQTEELVMEQALETIYDQITQDIVTATLAKW